MLFEVVTTQGLEAIAMLCGRMGATVSIPFKAEAEDVPELPSADESQRLVDESDLLMALREQLKPYGLTAQAWDVTKAGPNQFYGRLLIGAA